jgi:hypothetical protein
MLSSEMRALRHAGGDGRRRAGAIEHQQAHVIAAFVALHRRALGPFQEPR